MISAVIVISFLVLAAAFALAYLLWPGVRARIERPKYLFQQQLAMYEEQCRNGQQAAREHGDED